MDVKDRFWMKVDKSGECWLWTAALNNGYGVFEAGTSKATRRTVLTHRWAYEEANGEIPAGLTIDHTCHNEDESCRGGPTCKHRACVNPDHLNAATSKANTLASSRTPASINSRKTHCAEGHPLEMVGETRWCLECRRKQDRERRMRKRREAGIPAGRGVREAMKTHCPQGHPYDEANTYIRKHGGRGCRTCVRESNRRRRAKGSTG